MKKIISCFMFAIICSNVWVTQAFAALSQSEVNSVLSEKGLDMATLQERLDYFELTLNDFQSKEELNEFLGTPITDENLSKLLTKYGMTHEELDTLLAEYGTSIEEHWSIEEVDATINFYMNSEQEMEEIEEFLAAIGLTEEEIHKLFAHFESLDQLVLEEKMEQMGSRLETFLTYDPEAELTDAQVNELISLWDEMLGILQLQPKFSLVDANGAKTPISFRELSEMEEFTSAALFVELYNTNGELLLDLQVSAEMLSSDFIINAAEKLTDLGDLAGELTKLKHEQLPNTASSYGFNILLGVMVLLIGISSLLFIRLRTNKLVE